MSNEKTYRRECQQSIVLVRDGKRINLTTGQKFTFTQSEYDELMERAPGSISAKGTIDLDSGDVDLKKVETEQSSNQTNPPSDDLNKEATTKAAPKKTANQSDEL